MQSIDTLIFQFFLFAGCGWLLEVTYRSIENRRLINPGFNQGPWVPLYGIAAVVIILTHQYIGREPLHIRALAYFSVTTGLEYITGEIMLLVFKRRYWDYRDNFKNIRGHVCPSFSLAWVAACFVFELALLPASAWVIVHIDQMHMKITNVVLLAMLTVDFLYSSGLTRHTIQMGRKYGSAIAQRLEDIPEDMGSLLFNSPRLQLARRQLQYILDEEQIKWLEKNIRNHKNRLLEIHSMVFKRR